MHDNLNVTVSSPTPEILYIFLVRRWERLLFADVIDDFLTLYRPGVRHEALLLQQFSASTGKSTAVRAKNEAARYRLAASERVAIRLLKQFLQPNYTAAF